MVLVLKIFHSFFLSAIMQKKPDGFFFHFVILRKQEKQQKKSFMLDWCMVIVCFVCTVVLKWEAREAEVCFLYR